MPILPKQLIILIHFFKGFSRIVQRQHGCFRVVFSHHPVRNEAIKNLVCEFFLGKVTVAPRIEDVLSDVLQYDGVEFRGAPSCLKVWCRRVIDNIVENEAVGSEESRCVIGNLSSHILMPTADFDALAPMSASMSASCLKQAARPPTAANFRVVDRRPAGVLLRRRRLRRRRLLLPPPPPLLRSWLRMLLLLLLPPLPLLLLLLLRPAHLVGWSPRRRRRRRTESMLSNVSWTEWWRMESLFIYYSGWVMTRSTTRGRKPRLPTFRGARSGTPTDCSTARCASDPWSRLRFSGENQCNFIRKNKK
jgi:hypothetical protein